ncbi:MAG: hypothetical protein WD492_02300 [Alkalispirochaeta sp.]
MSTAPVFDRRATADLTRPEQQLVFQCYVLPPPLGHGGSDLHDAVTLHNGTALLFGRRR